MNADSAQAPRDGTEPKSARVRPRSPGLVLARTPGALSRRTLDCVLVLGENASEAVRLEGAATAVWTYLTEPATLGDLLNDLSQHFSVPQDRLGADLEPTLERLMIVGGLRVV